MIGLIKKYINKRVELLKLEMTELVSGLISLLLFYLIVLMLGMMFFFLFSLAIGFLIGKWFNDPGLGILIFSVVYLIAFAVLLLNYKRIKEYLTKKIIEVQYNNKDAEDNE